MIDYLKRVVMSRVTIGSLVVVVFYWMVAFILPEAVLREILDSIVIMLSVVLLVIYFPITSEMLTAPRLDRTSRLFLGITLAWFSLVQTRLFALAGRAFGQQAWFFNSHYFGFLLWLYCWAAIMHITAPNADAKPASRRGIVTVAVAVGIGGLFAGFVLGIRWQSLFGSTIGGVDLGP